MWSPELQSHVCATGTVLSCEEGQEQHVEWTRVTDEYHEGTLHCDASEQKSCPDGQTLKVEHEEYVDEHGHHHHQDLCFCEELHPLTCDDGGQITTHWVFKGFHEEHQHEIWEPEAFCTNTVVHDCPDGTMKIHQWNSETETETFSCHDIHHNSDSLYERPRVFHNHDHVDEEDQCDWVELNFEDGCHDDPEGLIAAEGFTCEEGIQHFGGLGACDTCHEIGFQWRTLWQLCPATCGRCDYLTFDCTTCVNDFVATGACYDVFENGADPLAYTSQECVDYCEYQAHDACFGEIEVGVAQAEAERLSSMRWKLGAFAGVCSTAALFYAIVKRARAPKDAHVYTSLL